MGRASPVLLALACALPACGGDDDTSGGGSGGKGGTGGSGGAAGNTTLDTQAPDFTGLVTAEQMGDSRVQLSWSAASDNVTPDNKIAYRVYSATEAGQEDFSSPHTTTPAGATRALVSDLSPNTHYFFVVRAIDGSGNEEDNAVEKDATTIDTTAPRFAGVTLVQAQTSHSLLVEWKPARDLGSLESEISYRVFVSASQGSHDFSNPTLETQPGETSAVITGLDPLTEYYVIVRAVDAAGNTESNLIERSDRTPEGIAPVFGGIVRAEPWQATIKLYWAPATDNISEQANIRYNIYQALATNAQDFSTPTFTTNPAVIAFVVPNTAPNTRYYYVVRALDSAGNEDGNTIQASARTGAGSDTVAPNFAGVVSVTGTSPSTLLVSWAAAHNDTTEPIVYYDVYASDTSGGQNFATPTLTAGPNVTSVTFAGLAPAATRFIVVRARDASGNVAANSVERSGTTLTNPTSDFTAPTWNSGPTLAQGSVVSALDVSWGTATDDAYTAADIRYHVCAEPQELDCIGTAFLKHIRASSDWGQNAITVTGVLPRTRYFVYVRAEDRSGNIETGNHGAAIVSRTGWSANVLPLFLDKCNACHDFSSPAKVTDVPSGFYDPKLPFRPGANPPLGLPLIWPGRPEGSYIYRKVNPLGLEAPPFSAAIPNTYAGLREPRDGANQSYTALSQEEDAILRDWIAQGALGN
jgi:hypothetical protein